MLKFKKSNIEAIANKITCNSELYGDEVGSVFYQLTKLSNSSNTFGCEMVGEVDNCWGGTVTVMAIPDKYQHSWSF